MQAREHSSQHRSHGMTYTVMSIITVNVEMETATCYLEGCILVDCHEPNVRQPGETHALKVGESITSANAFSGCLASLISNCIICTLTNHRTDTASSLDDSRQHSNGPTASLFNEILRNIRIAICEKKVQASIAWNVQGVDLDTQGRTSLPTRSALSSSPLAFCASMSPPYLMASVASGLRRAFQHLPEPLASLHILLLPFWQATWKSRLPNREAWAMRQLHRKPLHAEQPTERVCIVGVEAGQQGRFHLLMPVA